MPVMDGWTFRQTQRNDPLLGHIPVVVVSGADAERFHEIGAAAEFHKPVPLKELVRRLRELCGGPDGDVLE